MGIIEFRHVTPTVKLVRERRVILIVPLRPLFCTPRVPLDYREDPPNPPLQMVRRELVEHYKYSVPHGHFEGPGSVPNDCTYCHRIANPQSNGLIFGCGQDTRMFHNLLETLNGSIVFLESDPSWAAECRKTGAEVRLIHAT